MSPESFPKVVNYLLTYLPIYVYTGVCIVHYTRGGGVALGERNENEGAGEIM